jgi:hypothetical protein
MRNVQEAPSGRPDPPGTGRLVFERVTQASSWPARAGLTLRLMVADTKHRTDVDEWLAHELRAPAIIDEGWAELVVEDISGPSLQRPRTEPQGQLPGDYYLG